MSTPHNARHAALLVSPPEMAALLQGLNQQADSLVDRAMAKQWTRTSTIAIPSWASNIQYANSSDPPT